ncbi:MULTISPECIES: pyrimidine dimer DNA glycosylase/endonuclease V [unclassified Luteococcus]|uniref:pyrimidine dimer DNA glycosylase/endonuclease V n=1 Tax=unclassified Luteococcus TaxID=2639923 RepID=UPI00313AA44C
MRLWSLHPSLLDRQGLVALWREGLLAQAVLAGRTRGYRHHPQLERFRECPEPRAAVVAYLQAVADEADHRGHHFDRTRLDDLPAWAGQLIVTDGQLAHELAHLRGKLQTRNPHLLESLPQAAPPPHPLFRVVPGAMAPCERP